MADTDFSETTPSATAADPIFAVLGLAAYASDAFTAAVSARSEAEAAIGWETYKRADLEAIQAKAVVALDEAERLCLATKPRSLQGATALLAFVRRILSDDPMMPDSIHRTVAALGNVQMMMEATLRVDDNSQAEVD